MDRDGPGSSGCTGRSREGSDFPAVPGTGVLESQTPVQHPGDQHPAELGILNGFLCALTGFCTRQQVSYGAAPSPTWQRIRTFVQWGSTL